MELYKDREWLYEKYVNENMSAPEIAALAKCGRTTVLRYLTEFQIPIRHGRESCVGRERSEATKRKISEATRGESNPMYGVRGDKHPWYGRKHSDETKAKISAANQGRKRSTELKTLWSKQRLGKNNPIFGRHGKDHPAYGYHHTQEAKGKIRQSKLGDRNPFYGKHHSPEAKLKFSRPFTRHKGVWFVKEGSGDRLWMRSSWEIRVAKALTALGISWEYEPKRFTLRDRTYLPDFYLPEIGVYWEVKGWFSLRDQETVRQFRELYPEYPLIVVDKQIMEMLEAQTALRLGDKLCAGL
jgi:hypothetical protein